ncbi:MAG: SurA N-terminal domain-containing protein [Candidatus Hydrogenedentes bacterium]|nr:SurA N-terminal domain-containing protein [Candidatus Hydrogenedentota bacterium]
MMLLFMFLGIGIPMLFFGVPTSGGPGNANGDIELASVGGVSIMASEFRRNLSTAARRQAARGGETPTFKELEEQGVAGEIFEQMLTSALISSLEAKRGFRVEQSFLEDRLKEDPMFQDDAGNFNGARYNSWVKANQRADWEVIYGSIAEQVSREVFMGGKLAAANRILDRDVEQQLIDQTSKIQMEYLKVEPPAVPTEAEIQAQYDKDGGEGYRKPQTYTVDYVAISLKPEGPSDKVKEILAKAKAGDDFAKLADENSDLATKNGGDLGWLEEREIELDYRKPLFALAVGGVSEPVKGPGGYYIYKVEEERINEETEKREVKARHIYIKVELSDLERADLEIKANALAEKTRETKDRRAAAAELGLPVATATGFSVLSTEIDGIPKVDAFQFRRGVDEEANRKDDKGEPAEAEFNVITGRDNLYVVQLVGDPTPGDIPPLSDIRDQVIDDATAAKRGSEEYKKLVTEYADKIVAQAKTLDEVKTMFPELNAQIKETRPFAKSEYLFQDQIYLQTPQIFDTLDGKEENVLAGPLTDFLGGTYFIALTNREEPTEEDKATWDEDGKALRDRMLASARFELTTDYMADLSMRYLKADSPEPVNISLDLEIYGAIVGLNDKDDAKATSDDAAGNGSGETAEAPASDGETEKAKGGTDAS